MKATIRGIECEGTPEELAAFERVQGVVPWRPPSIDLCGSSYPYRLSPVPCDHDFPVVWHGIVPPICGKCGAQAGGQVATFGQFTVRYSNVTGGEA